MAENVRIGKGTIRFDLVYRDITSDQGVTISAYGDVDGEETELLRFDCFDHQPHYHYGPRNKDERLHLDRTTEGDPLEWTLRQLENRLPDMLERAGYEELAQSVNFDALKPDLEELKALAFQMRESNTD